MLRDLVSQATRTGSAELEAITAERDFFREKYAEQIDAMEEMKSQLKESQRIIGKLRSQVLDLELEKQRLVEQVGGVGSATLKQIESSGGSTQTSVTALTCDDDMTTRSGIENNPEVKDEDADDNSDVGVDGIGSSNDAVKKNGPDEDRPTQACDEANTPDHDSEEENEEEDESDSDDDEADKIRANAERMLLWANYQTSKRSTPNTSPIQDDDDTISKAETETRSDSHSKQENIVYSLPTSLDKRHSSLSDDESTLGSYSRHHPEPSISSRTAGSGSGKIGALFNNLRNMIDPQSESDSDCESYDD